MLLNILQPILSSWLGLVPCHQEAAERMHANQIEEISEPIIYDQPHAQRAISSSQMIPVIQE